MRGTAGLAGAFALIAGAAQAQEAVGQWHGTLELGENRLRVAVTLEAGEGGALKGRLVSVDQTPAPIPLEKIVFSGQTLSFESARLQARFEGRWDAKAQAWTGTFTQGVALPLTLEKGPIPPRVRPQTPQPPFPYDAEQVAFDGPPGVKLAGTLTLPKGAGPFAAVVMITGSGPQDRDETLFDHKPFAVIADALTRRGVAVLRYDDRGVGGSAGPVANATSEDFAGDVAAAMAFLRTRKDIDPDRIGLIGHSEGASIAPMVAAANPRTAFVVLMAPPGVPGPQAMAAQRQAIAKVRGAGSEAIARNEATMIRFDQAMAQAPDLETAKAEAAKIAQEAPSLQARAQMRSFASAWYRWFMRYDPAPTLRKLQIPVLALNGSNDVQAPPDPNLTAVRAALKDNPRATVVELPGLNHLFQTSATGDPRDYARIEETLAPAALDRMVEWVVIQANAPPGSLR